MSNPNYEKVEQGGWWYYVTINDEEFKVLLDVPENTKPLQSSEINDVYDSNGYYVNPSLPENEELFEEIDKLLRESGHLY